MKFTLTPPPLRIKITAQQFLLAVSAPDSIAVFLCLNFRSSHLRNENRSKIGSRERYTIHLNKFRRLEAVVEARSPYKSDRTINKTSRGIKMSNLTILKTSIRSYENLFSLNDLHIASGGLEKHRPSLFARNEQTKELIKEIENDRSTKTIFALKTIRGGSDISKQGTWACEELVLSYAMWISPKFHLIVLRAFLAMHRNQPQQLALPEPEKKFSFEFTEYELQTVAWACFAFRRNNNLLHELYSPLAAIGSKFAVEARDNAVEYRNTLRRFNEVVKRITVDIEADPETNWRVLKHIRSFNEKIFDKVETTI